MKVGTIIRRLTKSGCPIGQYMIVTKIKNKRIYVRYFGNKNSFPLMMKENYREYSKGVARVSYWDHTAIKYSEVFYTHEVSKQWEKLYNDKPQIIQFSAIGAKPIFFVVDFWYECIRKGKPCIRVYFKNQIYDTTTV